MTLNRRERKAPSPRETRVRFPKIFESPLGAWASLHERFTRALLSWLAEARDSQGSAAMSDKAALEFTRREALIVAAGGVAAA